MVKLYFCPNIRQESFEGCYFYDGKLTVKININKR